MPDLVKREYMQLLDDVERATLMLENINNRIHALLDAHDDAVVKLKNELLKSQGKLP